MTAVTWSGGWHPLAERFPMLDEDELRQMAASISKNGQFVPCRMSLDGLGLDGRNRTAACALAGLEPSWEVYEGEPITFIVEVNAERRHLSTGQRAMATAIGLADAGLRANGRFKRGSVPDNAGPRVSGWLWAVRQAGLVLDHAPDLADPVLSGGLALDAAYNEARSAKERKERLDALGTDLSGLVDAGVVDLAEAERRIAETERIEQLPEDLAKRVRDGGLGVDEAETIAIERDQRIEAWADQVRRAVETLAPMVGNPVAPELRDKLSSGEHEALRQLISKEN